MPKAKAFHSAMQASVAPTPAGTQTLITGTVEVVVRKKKGLFFVRHTWGEPIKLFSCKYPFSPRGVPLPRQDQSQSSDLERGAKAERGRRILLLQEHKCRQIPRKIIVFWGATAALIDPSPNAVSEAVKKDNPTFIVHACFPLKKVKYSVSPSISLEGTRICVCNPSHPDHGGRPCNYPSTQGKKTNLVSQGIVGRRFTFKCTTQVS